MEKPVVEISADYKISLRGRCSAAIFDLYKGIVKYDLRCQYLGAPTYAWALSPDYLDAARRLFAQNKFELVDMTSLDPEALEIAQEIQGKIKKTVKIRFENNKICFKSIVKSELFNEIFNNKSGRLTGVTEYLESTYERATCSFALAQEAFDVLLDAGFFLEADSSYEQAKREYALKMEAFKQQDAIITTKIAPGFTLFAHQNRAVKFIEEAQGRCLLGACMGSGKSLMTLAYAAKYNLRVCVVAPKVMRRTWVQEARKFFPNNFLHGLELDRMKKNMPNPCNLSLVSLNYESVDKWESYINEGKFDLLIIDESHYVKNFKAMRTRALLELSKNFRHVVLLSGTAIKNNRNELNPQLKILDPDKYSENCELFSLPVGKFWHEIQSVFLSMPKNEVLSFLPSKTTIRFDDNVENPSGLPLAIDEIMKIKHECARSKIRSTIEKIQDILESSDDNILVFSEFVDVVQAIYNHFEDDAIYHDGQMSQENREKAKESFQKGENGVRIFCSTRPSLAVGATLTRASHVVFNDLPWNAADIQQAEDRTHRIGQHKPVTVHWIIAANSDFDCRLIQLIEKKYRIQKAVTEGKQITKEEEEYLKKPISFTDIMGE